MYLVSNIGCGFLLQTRVRIMGDLGSGFEVRIMGKYRVRFQGKNQGNIIVV
jgi:hypothetical protein